MMSHSRASLAVDLIVVSLGFAACMGLDMRSARADASAATTQPSSSDAVFDLQYGPVTTFQQLCARCHGPEGAFYGPNFANMDDEKLLQMVTMMMRGPGALKPTDADVLAMRAYSHAIRAKKPFVVVTNAAAFTAGRDKALRGEASEGADVEVRKDGRAVPVAKPAGATWSLNDPPTSPFDVVVRRAGTEATFSFPARQWSVP